MVSHVSFKNGLVINSIRALDEDSTCLFKMGVCLTGAPLCVCFTMPYSYFKDTCIPILPRVCSNLYCPLNDARNSCPPA